MEKMKYESPEMEMIRFDTHDLIMTSELDQLPVQKP